MFNPIDFEPVARKKAPEFSTATIEGYIRSISFDKSITTKRPSKFDGFETNQVPDLHSEESLASVNEAITANDIIHLKAVEGTGKTKLTMKALKAIKEDCFVLALTTNICLTNGLQSSLVKSLDKTIVHYGDKDAKQEIQNADGFVCTLDSIAKYSSSIIDACDRQGKELVIVTDEIEQALGHIEMSSTFLEQGSTARNKCRTAFQTLVGYSHKAILLDARFKKYSAELLQRLFRSKSMGLVECTQPARSRKITYYNAKSTEAVSVLSAKKQLLLTTKSLIACSECADADVAETYCLSIGRKTLKITSETTDQEEVKAFFEDPTKVSERYDVIVCSPSLQTGVSIENPDYTVAFLLGTNSSIGIAAMVQQLNRVRNAQIWVIGAMFNKPTITPKFEDTQAEVSRQAVNALMNDRKFNLPDGIGLDSDRNLELTNSGKAWITHYSHCLHQDRFEKSNMHKALLEELDNYTEEPIEVIQVEPTVEDTKLTKEINEIRTEGIEKEIIYISGQEPYSKEELEEVKSISKELRTENQKARLELTLITLSLPGMEIDPQVVKDWKDGAIRKTKVLNKVNKGHLANVDRYESVAHQDYDHSTARINHLIDLGLGKYTNALREAPEEDQIATLKQFDNEFILPNLPKLKKLYGFKGRTKEAVINQVISKLRNKILSSLNIPVKSKRITCPTTKERTKIASIDQSSFSRTLHYLSCIEQQAIPQKRVETEVDTEFFVSHDKPITPAKPKLTAKPKKVEVEITIQATSTSTVKLDKAEIEFTNQMSDYEIYIREQSRSHDAPYKDNSKKVEVELNQPFTKYEAYIREDDRRSFEDCVAEAFHQTKIARQPLIEVQKPVSLPYVETAEELAEHEQGELEIRASIKAIAETLFPTNHLEEEDDTDDTEDVQEDELIFFDDEEEEEEDDEAEEEDDEMVYRNAF